MAPQEILANANGVVDTRGKTLWSGRIQVPSTSQCPHSGVTLTSSGPRAVPTTPLTSTEYISTTVVTKPDHPADNPVT